MRNQSQRSSSSTNNFAIVTWLIDCSRRSLIIEKFQEFNELQKEQRRTKYN